jgi:cation/acetate symporter
MGMVSAIVLVVLSPAVWPGPDSQGSPITRENPAIISIPLGFLGYLGTVLSRRRSPRLGFEELLVRQHTGLGAVAAAAGAPVSRPR